MAKSKQTTTRNISASLPVELASSYTERRNDLELLNALTKKQL